MKASEMLKSVYSITYNEYTVKPATLDKLDSRFIDIEDSEALKKAGLINIDNLIKLLMTDMIKKKFQASVNIDKDKVTQFDEKELAIKQFKEELKKKIKELVDKWEGERIDNTIYRLSGEELNNMRLDDLEEILKILD